MKPLSIYIVPYQTVEMLTSHPPIPSGDLENYLSLRPGILSDGGCDIFDKNCRSETQAWTAFELWERKHYVEPGTAVVFPFWLELFENFGVRHHIRTCIEWLKATYPDNPVLVQWNHDRDAATVPELQDLPANFFVIQFNTSKPTENDILVPFWAIENRMAWHPDDDRPTRGGFIGYVGGVKLRQVVRKAFIGQTGWEIHDTVSYGVLGQPTYLKHMLTFDFALCPRGGGLNSYRFYEAIQCGCVPILFADDVALPYPDLNWGDICIRIVEAMADNADYLRIGLQRIDVKARRRRLANVRERMSLKGVQEEIYRRLAEYLA